MWHVWGSCKGFPCGSHVCLFCRCSSARSCCFTSSSRAQKKKKKPTQKLLLNSWDFFAKHHHRHRPSCACFFPPSGIVATVASSSSLLLLRRRRIWACWMFWHIASSTTELHSRRRRPGTISHPMALLVFKDGCWKEELQILNFFEERGSQGGSEEVWEEELVEEGDSSSSKLWTDFM